ncbi:Homeodomain-like [Phytophthora cactorum]|nr:Homeodomain-like [Phytophthora cactorum]
MVWELDLRSSKWVNDRVCISLSSLILTLEAKEIAAEYIVEDFEVSWCWQHAFKARHNLSVRQGREQDRRPLQSWLLLLPSLPRQ